MSNFKTGIDYFSFDVDFFEDPKIEFITAKFGTKGEIITIKLLCRIYRNGYYLEWDEDQAILFAKRVGDGISYSLVNDVVSELIKRGFFDETIFNSFGVLTSRGIQRRYFEASKRRKNFDLSEQFLLITPKCIQDVSNLTQNVYNLPENACSLEQSKVKESKVKERKEKESKVSNEDENAYNLTSTFPTSFSNLTSLEKLTSLFKSYSRIQNPNEEQHLKPLLKFYNQVYENMKPVEVDECVVDAFKKLNPEKGVRMEFLIDNIQANITSKNEEKLSKIKEIELKEAELLRKEKAKQDLADAKKHDLEKLQQYKLFYETNSKLFTTSEKAELVKFLEAGRIISAGKIIEPKMEEFSLF